MTAIRWMVVLSVASWVTLVGIAGLDFIPEFTAGMLGPLVVVTTSSWVVLRTHRTSPGRVQQVLMASFLVKALFFALYVVTAIEVLRVRTVPFALSFVGYFVVLYALQALLMRRLFASNVQASA